MTLNTYILDVLTACSLHLICKLIVLYFVLCQIQNAGQNEMMFTGGVEFLITPQLCRNV